MSDQVSEDQPQWTPPGGVFDATTGRWVHSDDPTLKWNADLGSWVPPVAGMQPLRSRIVAPQDLPLITTRMKLVLAGAGALAIVSLGINYHSTSTDTPGAQSTPAAQGAPAVQGSLAQGQPTAVPTAITATSLPPGEQASIPTAPPQLPGDFTN